MKTIILATVTAIAAAGPVLAASPLERAAAIFAQSHETGDGPRGVPAITTDGVSLTSAGGADVVAFARTHFAKSHETGDGPRYKPGHQFRGSVFSSSNQGLAAFAAAKLHNDERGDN